MSTPDPKPGVFRQYVLVEVQARAPIADLADKVAGRAWPLADGADGMLLDSHTAYKLARAQMDEGRG